SISENAGYNVTNFTIIEFSSNFSEINAWKLSGLTLYAGAMQMPRVAHMLVVQGQIYLILTGEYANDTLNYRTEIYKLSDGQYSHVLSLNKYLNRVATDGTHIYLLSSAREIDEYDSTFSFIAAKSDISQNNDVYNDIRAQNGKIYLAGESTDSSGKTTGAYFVASSDLSTVDKYLSLNATGEITALDTYDNNTVFVNGAGDLYVLNNIYAVYAGRTNMQYVKSLGDGNYYDLSNDIIAPVYVKMYSSENSSTMHYVWGGFAQTWRGDMYMFITLTDRPAGWTDYSQAAAWTVLGSTVQSALDNPALLIVAGAAVVVGIVIYDYERRRL
ncbi:MAG: hypothetical protein GXO25_01670, partial [Euryarchaeota archaeon]|nr:hypothetical protein [Euryarchaeota archaeon]